jgi:hypothetical protein
VVRRIDIRRIANVQGRSQDTTGFAATALDSHADTSCAGSNTAVLEVTGEMVTVYPISEKLPAVQKVPIESFAMSGDGLDGRPEDSICDQGNLSKALGYWLGCSSQDAVDDNAGCSEKSSISCGTPI